MKKNIIILVVACIISFFAGRSFSDVEYSVKIVKGPTLRATVSSPAPINVNIPNPENYVYVEPKGADESTTPVVTSTPSNMDSAIIATVRDFNIEREYAANLFDNNDGKLDYKALVQYNRLTSLSYEYTPMRTEITKVKSRAIVPFITSDISSFGILGVGGGIFNKNGGLKAEYEYNLDTKKKGFSIGIIYKFN